MLITEAFAIDGLRPVRPTTLHIIFGVTGYKSTYSVTWGQAVVASRPATPCALTRSAIAPTSSPTRVK